VWKPKQSFTSGLVWQKPKGEAHFTLPRGKDFTKGAQRGKPFLKGEAHFPLPRGKDFTKGAQRGKPKFSLNLTILFYLKFFKGNRGRILYFCVLNFDFK